MPDTEPTDADAASAGSLLRDAFGRIHELIPNVLDDASGAVLAHRPDGVGNSIGWLVWHTIRIQDDHVAGVAGVDQAWTAEGWHERFGLPFHAADTGYGHTSAEVDAAGSVTPEQLLGYHEAVHALTERYLSGIDADELGRVVDERWDPPVTASVRLVSVIGDALAHLGQAAYIRGLVFTDE